MLKCTKHKGLPLLYISQNKKLMCKACKKSLTISEQSRILRLSTLADEELTETEHLEKDSHHLSRPQVPDLARPLDRLLSKLNGIQGDQQLLDKLSACVTESLLEDVGKFREVFQELREVVAEGQRPRVCQEVQRHGTAVRKAYAKGDYLSVIESSQARSELQTELKNAQKRFEFVQRLSQRKSAPLSMLHLKTADISQRYSELLESYLTAESNSNSESDVAQPRAPIRDTIKTTIKSAGSEITGLIPTVARKRTQKLVSQDDEDMSKNQDEEESLEPPKNVKDTTHKTEDANDRMKDISAALKQDKTAALSKSQPQPHSQLEHERKHEAEREVEAGPEPEPERKRQHATEREPEAVLAAVPEAESKSEREQEPEPEPEPVPANKPDAGGQAAKPKSLLDLLKPRKNARTGLAPSSVAATAHSTARAERNNCKPKPNGLETVESPPNENQAEITPQPDKAEMSEKADGIPHDNVVAPAKEPASKLTTEKEAMKDILGTGDCTGKSVSPLVFCGVSSKETKAKDADVAGTLKTILEAADTREVKVNKMLTVLAAHDDIHKLQFEGIDITNNAQGNAAAIAAVLRKIVALPKLKLKEIVSDASSLSMVLNAAAGIKGLQMLSLDGLTLESSSELLDCVKSNRRLTALSLCNCTLNFAYDSSSSDIARILEHSRTLKTFKVIKCNLLDTDMECLRDALLLNRTLIKLDLSENSITLEGMKHILESCKTNHTLETLVLNRTFATLDGIDPEIVHMLDNRPQPLNAYVD